MRIVNLQFKLEFSGIIVYYVKKNIVCFGGLEREKPCYCCIPGGGATANPAPVTVLAENKITCLTEPEAKSFIQKRGNSFVAALPQNDMNQCNGILRCAQSGGKKLKQAAFTMAEVLITLGIIGIVAAMTLPAFIANHRKQVMLAKVKHTYNIIANAFERAKVDYGTDINYWYLPESGSQLEKSMFFAETYLLPYLNAPIYCADKPTAPYCFYQVKYLAGNDTANWGPADNNSGTALLLDNGVALSVTVGELATLNPDDPINEAINRIRILFDIDGPKGYNRYGYDVFWLELGGAEGRLKGNNADKNKILPYGYDFSKACDYYISDINYACSRNAQYSGGYCLAYIFCNSWDAGKNYPW